MLIGIIIKYNLEYKSDNRQNLIQPRIKDNLEILN